MRPRAWSSSRIWWNLRPKLRDIDTFDDARYEKPAVGSSEPVDVERSGRQSPGGPPNTSMSHSSPPCASSASSPRRVRRPAWSPATKWRRLSRWTSFYAEPAACTLGPNRTTARPFRPSPISADPGDRQDPVPRAELPGGHVRRAASAPKAPDVFGQWCSTLNVDGGWYPGSKRRARTTLGGENSAAVVGASWSDTPAARSHGRCSATPAFNDVSARTYQRAGTQFTLRQEPGRLGPRRAVEVLPPPTSSASTYGRSAPDHRVNGEVMQNFDHRPAVISASRSKTMQDTRVTRCLSLRPGNVTGMVTTGTPPRAWGPDGPGQAVARR